MVYDKGKWLHSADYFNMSDEENKEVAALVTSFVTMPDAEIDRLDKVSLADFMKEKVTSPKIVEYFNIMGMVQSTLSNPEIISMGEFVSIYREEFIRGGGDGMGNVRMPLGGIGMMTMAQADAAAEAGVKFEYKTSVKKVIASKSGMIKVVTETGEYAAPRVVMALPIWEMVKLFSDDDKALPKGWLQHMRTLVDETSASIGFTIAGKKALFTEPVYLSAWDIPGVGLPLQVFIQTNFDNTIAPPGHMIAFIGACCTPKQARDEQFCKEVTAKFWETLQKMFPGLEETCSLNTMPAW